MSLPIVILGSGRMATALARAFAVHRSVRLWARDAEAAQGLASKLGQGTDGSPSPHALSAHVELDEALTGDVHAVLLAVSDGAITELAERLATLAPAELEHKTFLHLSGYHGTSALAPLAAAAPGAPSAALPPGAPSAAPAPGVNLACLHPNAAVSTDARPDVFHGVHFGIGGEGEALERARDLALELGGKPLVVADEDRPRYHAAATMLAGGLVALFGQAEDLLTSALGEEQRGEARDLLRGLLATTNANLQRGAPEDVLTGPVARDDDEVVRGHERALERAEEGLLGPYAGKRARDLYRRLAYATRQLMSKRYDRERELAGSPSSLPEHHSELWHALIVTLGARDITWRGDQFEVDPRGLVWRFPIAAAEIVELRLDQILPRPEDCPGHSREQLVELLVQELAPMLGKLELLVTCHPTDTPGTAGRFEGSTAERLALLAAGARAGASYVDLDAALVDALLDRWEAGDAPDLGSARLLLSRHLDLPPCEPVDDATWQQLHADRRNGADVEGITHLAPGGRVDQRLDRALAELEDARARLDGTKDQVGPAGSTGSASLADRVAGLKLVGVVERGEEALELLGWTRLRRRSPIVPGPKLGVFAGGVAGAFARALAPVFGSNFVFAAASSADVPGQLSVQELCSAWPNRGMIFADSSRALGVLGHPVAGSLSPDLYHALRDSSYNVELVFVRFDFAEPDAVLRFAVRHGVGLSVTAPHKAAARRFAANSMDKGLRSIGAANTLVPVDHLNNPPPELGPGASLVGFNTDVVGVRAALDALFARPGLTTDGDFCAHAAASPERPVVVLGAGGAARAVLAALGDYPAGTVRKTVVLARDPRRAMALAREFGAAFGGLAELASLEPLVLVHATTAGSHASPDPSADWLPGEAVLADLARRAPTCRILDANYRPSPTPLVAVAQRLGLEAQDGRTWFLAQALAQFELLTGDAFGRHVQDDGYPPSLTSGHMPIRFRDPRPKAYAGLLLDRVLEETESEPSRERGTTRNGSRTAKPVVLVGQRGSGKSAVAKQLGERDGWIGLDLDAELARQLGRGGDHGGAGALLTELGERRFRVLEAALLEGRLASSSRLDWVFETSTWVLALGGGAVETPRVRELLADCTVVWLRATPEELAERVAADPTPRPPIAAGGGATDPLDEARAVAARRDPLYAEVADHEIVTSGRTPAEVAAELAARLAT